MEHAPVLLSIRRSPIAGARHFSALLHAAVVLDTVGLLSSVCFLGAVCCSSARSPPLRTTMPCVCERFFPLHSLVPLSICVTDQCVTSEKVGQTMQPPEQPPEHWHEQLDGGQQQRRQQQGQQQGQRQASAIIDRRPSDIAFLSSLAVPGLPSHGSAVNSDQRGGRGMHFGDRCLGGAGACGACGACGAAGTAGLGAVALSEPRSTGGEPDSKASTTLGWAARIASGPPMSPGIVSRHARGPPTSPGIVSRHARGPPTSLGVVPRHARGPPMSPGIVSRHARGPPPSPGVVSWHATGPPTSSGIVSRHARGLPPSRGILSSHATGPPTPSLAVPTVTAGGNTTGSGACESLFTFLGLVPRAPAIGNAPGGPSGIGQQQGSAASQN